METQTISSVSAQDWGTYRMPVVMPKAPAFMAFLTSAFMASSSPFVGARIS